jgi:predicted ATPase
MLVTSREPLQISGETSFPVPPLSLPDVRRFAVVQDLIKYEGSRLFVERAVAVLPTFEPTDRNAPEIARICHQLDGIPLALELAAARVKGLSVDQIAAKLADGFRLLTRGSRTAVPHHQTLQMALDWSFNLLSGQEKIVFRRLAVFVGGFTLEAAEAVCAGEGLDGSEILDLLTRLADKSLVMFEDMNGEARYRLLETLRQYGRDRLLQAGEADEVRRRHCNWFLALAERAEPEFSGPHQSVWYGKLEPEHDNFREALVWSIGADPDAGLRLAGALHWYWHTRGYLSEARGWLERTLSASGDTTTISRAKALYAAGWQAYFQRDYAQAIMLGRASLSQFQDLGEKRWGAFSLVLLAHVAQEQDEYERATAQLEESLAIFRELGYKRGIGISLNALGEGARCRGDYVAARALYEENLPLWRELGDEQMIGISLHNLGYVARHRGDHGQAAALFKESLAIRLKLGNEMGIAYCLAGLASVAAAQSQPERAARRLGAAEAMLERIGGRMYKADLLEYDRTVASARAALDERALAAARSEGRAMSLAQAVEDALSA